MKLNYSEIIESVQSQDIRFPTSLEQHGSDAMHTDPDYSVAYVTISTQTGKCGYGMTFTCGRGTEVVCCAVNALKFLLVHRNIDDIFGNFRSFWRELTSEPQLRWLGPEKGVINLAVSAIISALWDLWGKLEGKPVWKLLTDMEPEFLISLIDFRYCTDLITEEEALQILKDRAAGKKEREKNLISNGYPCYTTASGWLGYSDDTMKALCKKYLDQNFTAFKMKIGQNLDRDKERCKIMRDMIGKENILMVDANQVFDVQQAIDWVSALKEFNLLWIEEPTSPDDILGHARIAKALMPHGIKVATGEVMCNRVMFKQFMQANAFEYCQVDSARIGGVNELLIVYLMAHKSNIKVCPHAGGVGLSEMVQHLQFWDYTSLSGTKDGRYIEYVDQQHEQFINPVVVRNANYMPQQAPGFNTQLSDDCIKDYAYPMGLKWQEMLAKKS